MNRIEAAIRKMKSQIAERIASGETTEARVEATRKSLDMELDEFAKFQELKSLAMVEDKLTQEEAQLIYSYLGETPEHFNRQAVEVKAVLTRVFHELLKARIDEVRKPNPPNPPGWEHV